MKSVGMIIGEKAPTIVPPEDYKKRFRISMDSYFVTVEFGVVCKFVDARSVFPAKTLK